MAYVSTKCRAKGRHCDCVTGPKHATAVTKDICACPCHTYPGATREMFDAHGMDYDEVRRYAVVITPGHNS